MPACHLTEIILADLEFFVYCMRHDRQKEWADHLKSNDLIGGIL